MVLLKLPSTSVVLCCVVLTCLAWSCHTWLTNQTTQIAPVLSIDPTGLLKGVSNADGHPFVLPTDYYHWGVYYRKSLLADHGKTAPETWIQFTDLCAYFKGKGLLPISIGIKWRWTLAAWFDVSHQPVMFQTLLRNDKPCSATLSVTCFLSIW
jgi:hypothetical protein